MPSLRLAVAQLLPVPPGPELVLLLPPAQEPLLLQSLLLEHLLAPGPPVGVRCLLQRGHHLNLRLHRLLCLVGAERVVPSALG